MSIPSEISEQTPLLVVGCGKMGGSLLEGWLAAGLSPAAVKIVDPLISSIGDLLPPQVSRYSSLDDIERDIAPRLILVAVKPQVVDEVISPLAHIVTQDSVVLSIAAGIPIAWFERKLGATARIVRAMPNTPSAVGRGVAVLTANRACTKDDTRVISRMMEVSGSVHWIDDESLLDAVTGLSGSGPAYVCLLAEAMAAGGVAAGLDRSLSETLARQTLIGACSLLEKSDESPEQLRRNVTSPKGTTEAALEVLTKDEMFERLVKEAILAATRRSQELSVP